MNKLILFFSMMCTCSVLFAQDIADGYYRVYNKAEERYIYVTDNHGNVNSTGTEMDHMAVQLIAGSNKTISNPATVLYVKNISGSKYDIEAQGTSIYEILGNVPQIKWVDRAQAYEVYVESNGIGAIYLGSKTYPSDEIGFISTNATGSNRHWIADPISSNSENYFGITPSIQINDKYYHPFYAEFAFSFASEGMKAYYISEMNGGIAKLMPIEDKVIPGETPVIIECSSDNPSNNRLEIIYPNGSKINDNILAGNYFCNIYRPVTAVVKYDSKTMRVLGKTADGKLGFVVSTEENLAANQSYLPVTLGAETTIVALSASEYASIEIPVIDDVISGVYSILGVKLRQDSNIDNLPSGIYIVNGKKIIKR